MRGDGKAFIGLAATTVLGLMAACSAGGEADKAPVPGGSGAAAGSGASSSGGSGAAASGGAGGSGASSSGGSGGGTSGAGGSVTNPPKECEGVAQDAGGFTFSRIGKWRDDATAAYSMIHDDMCGPALRGIDQNAVPALNARGLHAGLAPFVDACESAGLWDIVKSAEADGHEIINHSYTHPEISPENAAQEVTQAKADFEAQLQNPVTFYVFPFDFWTPETLQLVGNAGHLGARAGSRDDNDGFDNPPINSASPGTDLEIEFDVWPRTFSKYALFQESHILSVHVWNAIEQGGWALREFHSVSTDANPPNDGSQGFGPVPLATYEEHLDFLVAAWQNNEVWTDNPSTVLKYRHARTACKASVSGSTISFDTSDPDCTKYATPISVIVTTGNDVSSVEAKQGGAPVSSRKLGPSEFSITADPTQGDVELAGCSTAAVEVGGATLASKPSPADSVCDLQQVVGNGADGSMDDLERGPDEQFQTLPNPGQADGRDGSWSWYPQNATVELTDEGGNSVLRYAGDGLNAWSGVTLAFLGGNGAGACYDASQYSGIRFKIKGNVSSSDELNGKVILSLVTAETQTRTFGGDLDGEGGHFNKQVDVTGSWQTVSVAWGEFNQPTWGATTSLSSVALSKMQALDWGVSNNASSFEIFLDDIELY